jgi:hypothetical protein
MPPRLNVGGPGEFTVSVKPLVRTAPPLSATVILKLKSPVAVGVPDSVPLTKLTPGGKLPPGVKRYGGTPPVPPKVMLIAVPTETGVVGPPVIPSGAGWMMIVKPRDPLPPVESAATTVKGNCPGVFGVPVMNPAEESVSPSGRLPPPSEKLYGPLPPLAPSEPEYGTPTTPAGKLPEGETCGPGEVMSSGNCAFTVVFDASCRVL